jgi:hypothetical protein
MASHCMVAWRAPFAQQSHVYVACVHASTRSSCCKKGQVHFRRRGPWLALAMANYPEPDRVCVNTDPADLHLCVHSRCSCRPSVLTQCTNHVAAIRTQDGMAMCTRGAPTHVC